MKWFVEVSKSLFKTIQYVKSLSKKKTTNQQLTVEAIDFYCKIYQLLHEGYKFAIEDSEGNRRYFGLENKKKPKKQPWEDDEDESEFGT